MTVPSPPRLLDKRHATQNKTANMRTCEPQTDQETAHRDTCQVYRATGAVCHFFRREYFTLKSCTCPTGATGMGSPATGLAASLAATWAAGLAACLEGLAGHFASLGAGLAAGLTGGSSPCGIQFASGTSRVKCHFLFAKTFAKPHTPGAFFAHTISVSDALSLSSSTPLGRPLSTDVSDDTSESVAVCEAWDDNLHPDPDPDPEVPVPSLSPSDELAEKEGWKEG